jgi:hypothetical protein
MDSVTIPEEEHKNEITKKPRPQHEIDSSLVEVRRNKSMTALVSRMFNEAPKDDQAVEVGVDVAAVTGGRGSPVQKNKAFRAKPSELREMNCWSPTSM